MAYELRDNSGTLFRNDKREGQPTRARRGHDRRRPTKSHGMGFKEGRSSRFSEPVPSRRRTSRERLDSSPKPLAPAVLRRRGGGMYGGREQHDLDDQIPF